MTELLLLFFILKLFVFLQCENTESTLKSMYKSMQSHFFFKGVQAPHILNILKAYLLSYNLMHHAFRFMAHRLEANL